MSDPGDPSSAPSRRRGAGPFRTMELTPSGWVLVTAGGVVLGLGLGRAADLSPVTGPLIGVALLLLALVVFDRWRARRGTAYVFAILTPEQTAQVLREARAAGLRVTAGVRRRERVAVPAGRIPLRVRRRDVERVVEIVDRHAPA